MTTSTQNGIKFCPIPEHPDYMISRCGQVWTCKRSRLLTPVFSARYFRVRLGRKGVLLHRAMAAAFLGASSNDFVDHIDGDTRNNVLENLRIATRQQNMFNRKPNRNGVSVYKGVGWSTRAKRWRSRIRHEGKQHLLGYFNCQIEAAEAYDAAARKFYGEFARPNFAFITAS